MSFCRISDLLPEEKPREKLTMGGAAQLSSSELVALVIRTGGKGISAIELARSLLKKYESLKGLCTASFEQLKLIKDIGPAKAASIKAAFELGLRLTHEDAVPHFRISKPKDVFNVLRKDLFGKTKEHLYLLCLDTHNRLISKSVVSIGDVSETLMSAREIYRTALLNNAGFIIIAHNHPSNDPRPSAQDILVTQDIAEVGKKMGIPLIDHVIVTENEFTSLKSQI